MHQHRQVSHMSWPVGSARTFWDVLERQADACGDREAVVRGASRLTFARWRA
jgi:hypothetical protein